MNGSSASSESIEDPEIPQTNVGLTREALEVFEKHRVAFFFLGILLFVGIDGAIEVGWGGGGVKLGPLRSAEIRSVLILIGGICVALGTHEFFLKRTGKLDLFQSITLYAMLLGLIVASYWSIVSTALEPSMVVAKHGVDIDTGEYFVTLTSAAMRKNAGSYLVLIARKADATKDIHLDSEVTISAPFRLDATETDRTFQVSFLPPESYKNELRVGPNEFDCWVMIVPANASGRVRNAKTIDQLEQIGATKLRIMNHFTEYRLPHIDELKRKEFKESLTEDQRSQLLLLLQNPLR